MKKSDVVRAVLGERYHKPPIYFSAKTFAPTNIALCKYWGKRDQGINLPMTSSLSVSLGEKGATTELTVNDHVADTILLNGQAVERESAFSLRLVEFIDLFRQNQSPRCEINITSNIPIAAGLASSACGFAAMILALDELYGWKLNPSALSILARLGSGSAARSIWPGFVEWHAGMRYDGMDSHGEALSAVWPTLCVGLLTLSDKEKMISSRVAMQRTVATSPLYSAWPSKVNRDLATLKQAINDRDMHSFGKTAESNATTMHATMLSAWPPIIYAIPETLSAIQKVWQLRDEGLPIYFTQDAGPNIKLLFLAEYIETIRLHFPSVEIIQPFAHKN